MLFFSSVPVGSHEFYKILLAELRPRHLLGAAPEVLLHVLGLHVLQRSFLRLELFIGKIIEKTVSRLVSPELP